MNNDSVANQKLRGTENRGQGEPTGEAVQFPIHAIPLSCQPVELVAQTLLWLFESGCVQRAGQRQAGRDRLTDIRRRRGGVGREERRDRKREAPEGDRFPLLL